MGRMLKEPWRIAGWVAPVALGLLLVTTTVRCAADSLPLYEALFERHSVSERTGITPEGLAHVGREVQAYFASGDDSPLSVTVRVHGVPRTLFNENEVSHMADVKALFLRVYRVQTISAVLLVALALLAAWRLRLEALLVVASWMRRGAVVTAAVILVLGLLSAVAFRQVFIVFHYIGFPQGNWVFDPRTEFLVQVFPFGFWRDITLLIGVLILLETGVLWWVSGAVRRYGSRQRSGSEQSDTLTCLHTYPNELEARMAEGLLRDAGIRSMVRPAQAGYAAWGQNQFTAHGLWVLRMHEEEARTLLEGTC
ncbi:MAG: DUF1461 domain-containing protein [Chloroflexota bacterium]|nr:DUF1461 domain-containing protein [Chloroflexota bacterium]MDE2886397.1 DUF1461 domain-containing protein [Chloroflexota bacterium]